MKMNCWMWILIENELSLEDNTIYKKILHEAFMCTQNNHKITKSIVLFLLQLTFKYIASE